MLNGFRQCKIPALKSSRNIQAVALTAAAVIALLWFFPTFWYTRSPNSQFVWLLDQTNVVDWAFSKMPVSKAEEAVLTADVTFAGRFQRKLDEVHVFSAKRFSDRPNEIGLFVHTPDRCWTESGWKLSPVSPDVVTLALHGTTISLERRIFTWSDGRRFLVYFGGLNGGQPLAYRLDHNLSVGQKQQVKPDSDFVGTRARAANSKLWGHAWNVFASRQNVFGPKQFFRLSSEIVGSDIAAAEQRIQTILPIWLRPGDYNSDLQAFQTAPPSTEEKSTAPDQHGAGH